MNKLEDDEYTLRGNLMSDVKKKLEEMNAQYKLISFDLDDADFRLALEREKKEQDKLNKSIQG